MTPQEYLDSLPEERRVAISRVRDVVLANLPEGYEESVSWGMLSYDVPLATKPDTYNGKPLMYAALGSQKNHMALYLSGVYSDEETASWFESRYRESGKPLDMGKSCVRFKRVDDLPLDLVAETIALFPPSKFIDIYDATRAR